MANCTCHALRSSHNIGNLLVFSFNFTSRRIRNCNFSLRNCMVTPNESRKLVLEVKKKLEKEYNSLPVGKNGRDDEEMILWFLKDRKFSVEEAVAKLTKAIKWLIVDLRGFGMQNADTKFITFLFDVFYYYYPKRLDQVLLVDASFIFKPIWQLVKPLLKSYASLVRFCSAEDVRREYFTEGTLPVIFRG
ncbi:uncharacterized protein LOC110808021 [Carica papaya]|uniref:uncharacterized protein LOC110808021 n=1 Tax=Carica papaya TaxID=3649 RepID=UPI000B8D034F|nr:uncharacterized protein LOC110808021 [Carica papaya]